MLQAKDITSLEELEKYLSVPTKMVEQLLSLLSLFEFKNTYRSLNPIKQKGYKLSSLFNVLLLLPFLRHASVYALFKSRSHDLSQAQKDAYYRCKNNEHINWRKLLTAFVKRFIIIVGRKAEKSPSAKCCLIVDDSLLPKRGRAIEGVSKLWCHVSHSFTFGLRLLALCYYDGKSTLPVDFSLHREKGTNQSKPYGLSAKQRRQQYKKSRVVGAEGDKRLREADCTKMQMAVEMIRRALGFLKVDYVLMDSWFTCEAMLGCVRGYKKAAVHLIGMMKMNRARYNYKGKEYDATELLRKGKGEQGVKRCKKLNASYVVLEVLYKEYEVKLYFSRFGRRGKWHLLLSTDKELSYEQLMEQYQVRWSIEVFFKESKQYLNLGGCQSQDFDAQVADTTISMVQYVLLTLRKRFDDYETRGEVFRAAGAEMLEQSLQLRLWQLLLMLVKLIVETLGVVVEDIDACIKKLIQSDDFKKLMPLFFPPPNPIKT